MSCSTISALMNGGKGIMNGSNGVSPYWQSKEPEQDFPETLVLDFNNVDGPVIQSRPCS